MKLAKKIVNGIKNGVREKLDGTYMAKDYRMSRHFRDCLAGAMGVKVCLLVIIGIMLAFFYYAYSTQYYIVEARRVAHIEYAVVQLVLYVYMWADWVRTLICRAVSCKRKRKTTVIEIAFIVVLAPLALLKPLIWIVPVLFVINTVIEIVVLARKPERTEC